MRYPDQVIIAIITIFSLWIPVKLSSQTADTITSEQIQSASHLLNLEFSEAETDSMIEGLIEFRDNYDSIRKWNVNNFDLPALIFNPLPTGFVPSSSQIPLELETIPDLELPVNLSELAFYSIPELAGLIKSRKISCLELTEFFLERLKKYDDTLHCVISLTEKLALEQARMADEELKRGIYRGLLHGIPYGVKDLFAVPDYKTSWGAAPYRDQILHEEAAVVQKLREAGAVLVAKLTMGALAWGDVWYGGQTRNPWNPEWGSSGSSAGSASAVSAGLVPFAIGTETLGSIVSPSTVCGVTGLRPTFGRVSRFGAMTLSWSMDKIGPICRVAEDCAIVFDAIRGTDPRDPATIDADFNYNHRLDVRQLKIGYLKTVFESEYGFHQTDSLFLEIIRSAGFELIPVELPAIPNIRFILSAEASASFDELTRSNLDDQMVRQFKNAWPNVFRTARFIPAVEYIRANQIRRQLIQKMDTIFRDVDLYITPSWAGASLGITNLTGHPQVVIPNGIRDGMPVSISFVGKLFGEAELLIFANYCQKLTGYHKLHPSLFRPQSQ